MQLRCKFRQAKVQNLRLAALSDEDIGRLDVPMDDSLRVRRVQRVRDLNRQVKQRIRLQGLTLDMLLERLAFQQLHRDERLPLALVNVVDRTNVRVIERGSGFSFTSETFQATLGRTLTAQNARQSRWKDTVSTSQAGTWTTRTNA